MTIAFGRRRLIVSVTSAPGRERALHVPAAEQASDIELARLSSSASAMEHRRRWEADAILYGMARAR